MQVVDVLRDDLHVEMIFQFPDRVVSGIRLFRQQLAPPDVVEVDDRFAVASQCFGGAYVLDAVFVPQPVGVAESRDAAVGTDSGAGEDNDFFPVFHNFYFILLINETFRRASQDVPTLLAVGFGQREVRVLPDCIGSFPAP